MLSHEALCFEGQKQVVAMIVQYCIIGIRVCYRTSNCSCYIFVHINSLSNLMMTINLKVFHVAPLCVVHFCLHCVLYYILMAEGFSAQKVLNKICWYNEYGKRDRIQNSRICFLHTRELQHIIGTVIQIIIFH